MKLPLAHDKILQLEGFGPNGARDSLYIASAEVGNVNSTTIVVNFPEDIESPSNSYAGGWTFSIIGGGTLTISSATRQ